MKKTLVFGLFCMTVLTGNVRAAGLFPEITGWKMMEDKKVYTGNDLWELIDGAADIFLSYDFQDLHIAEYSNKDRIIRVELYRHSTPENAYGIYTAERMPDYPQITIGSQGYRSEGILNFLTGSYYVKIMSAGPVEAKEDVITQVAGKVNSTLAQQNGLPDVLLLFPEEGKENLSDAYIAQNFLGYSFLNSAFTMRYKNEAEFQLFIIKAASTEIQHMLDEYTKTLKDNKPRKSGDLLIIHDPFNGTLFLEQKRDYLVGVINTDNEGKATDYIGRVIKKLP
jgi:hypothetical protein